MAEDKNYEYVLFDLDGTLTDPAEGITGAASYALSKYGIVEQDMTKLYHFIGPPLIDTFMSHYGFDQGRAEEATEHFRRFFSVDGIRLNVPYDGVHDMLGGLVNSGRKLVLATSKPKEFAVQILKRFDMDPYFTYIGGATMDNSRTRKGDVIEYAMLRAGIDRPERALMVGDRRFDIEGAAQNGIDSMGVLYGYGSLQELQSAGAKYLAHSPIQVLGTIEKKL